MIRLVKDLVKRDEDLGSEGAPKTPWFLLHADEMHLRARRPRDP